MNTLSRAIPIKEKDLALIQVFYLFLLPPALLAIGIIPLSWRMPLLLLVPLLIYGIIRKEHWSKQMIGLKSITVRELLAYSIFTAAGVFLLWQGGRVMHRLHDDWWQDVRLLLFFLPVSALQEFAFRGILLSLLFQVFNNRAMVIFANVFLFAFIHIIYPPLLISIPLALLAGFGFTLMYLRYPNIVLISLSHAVLNFFAVGLAFFRV